MVVGSLGRVLELFPSFAEKGIGVFVADFPHDGEENDDERPEVEKKNGGVDLSLVADEDIYLAFK